VDESTLSSWLGLREPADRAARSAPLTRALVDRLPRGRPLRAVDLGAGSGSNVRYLESALSGGGDHSNNAIEWLLVDRDAALLEEARRRQPRVETRVMSLGSLDGVLFEGRDLVTASALLDLVSERWLQSLATYCRSAGAAALFALNYNGESHCTPLEPEDEAIRTLLNQHQRQNDQGFGRGAGPDASTIAARCFEAAGYSFARARSDWRLPPDARELQTQLISGWADAALEIAPERTSIIRGWLARRLAHVDAGRSHISVGHDDLAAWLEHA
jgi:hypothetical protein